MLPTIRKLTDRVRCMACGAEFKKFERHPESCIIFINGYPSPCPHNGEQTQYVLAPAFPWLRTVVLDVNTYLGMVVSDGLL